MNIYFFGIKIDFIRLRAMNFRIQDKTKNYTMHDMLEAGDKILCAAKWKTWVSNVRVMNCCCKYVKLGLVEKKEERKSVITCLASNTSAKFEYRGIRLEL